MENNVKQYNIFIRNFESTHLKYTKVPVTKEQFDDYYRDINAYRRTQMNHGRCVCPPSKWLLCNMDCWDCPYRTAGNICYLEEGLQNNDGEETDRLERLQEERSDLQTASMEDSVTDSIMMQEVLTRLTELMPQAVEIGKLRQQGLSDLAIAEVIGVRNTTFRSRLQSVRKKLEKEFPDFL